jgi:hypothetical protein
LPKKDAAAIRARNPAAQNAKKNFRISLLNLFKTDSTPALSLASIQNYAFELFFRNTLQKHPATNLSIHFFIAFIPKYTWLTAFFLKSVP